jgi:putative transposase
MVRIRLPPAKSQAKSLARQRLWGGDDASRRRRRRERIMKRFKSPRQVQRFLSAHDQVGNVFPRRRDHDTAANLRSGRTQAFTTWTDVTVAMAA